MEFEDILYTKEDGTGTITLNRPQTLNALAGSIQQEWMRAIEDAAKDDEVRVVVVTGAGRAFCAGANPRALDHMRQEQSSPTTGKREPLREGSQNMFRVVMDLDKPYIGAINGAAVGGGMDLASMCDIRIASDRAKFSMAYVRMGVIPASGGCYFLPRIVGIANACELIWTGRMIDAHEALRIGYVSKVVPHDELATATKELATQLAKGPAVAIKMAKRLIYGSLDLDLNEALEHLDQATRIVDNTEDAKEGPRAWVEKREPIFKGR
jgi:2-(1,2-epoxy-1,2-dihydrophenyl)acetyl-CoA isomerase